MSKLEDSLAFYARAFGFEASPGMRRDRAGRLVLAEVSHEGVPLITFTPAARSIFDVSPPRVSNLTCPVIQYVYCRDVDQLTARARAAGACILSEPADQPWGDRVARIEDLDGYMWNFATYQARPVVC
ncbi:MAG TPA: VOC family protein [Nevskiaceae bacterium]|nr:VOC family protein [Nevskiaceae bacterium]